MSHVSDFTQSEDKIVLDLVNHENSSSLTLEQVTVGAIAPGADTVDVTIAAIAGSGYTGSETVTYRRIDVEALLALYAQTGLTLQQGDAETLADFLPEINTVMSTNIQATDIVDGPLPVGTGTPNEELTATVAMVATSKVYFGSFSITIDGNDIPLSSIITATVLNGLNLPVVASLNDPYEFRMTRLGGQPDNLTIFMAPGSELWVAGAPLVPVNENPADPEEWLEFNVPVTGSVNFQARFNPDVGVSLDFDAASADDWEMEVLAWGGQTLARWDAGGSFLKAVPATLSTNVTNLDGMFRWVNGLRTDITGWNTSHVTSMAYTFADSDFNQDISGWDTSSVVSMERTFNGNVTFNQNLYGWNVDNVANYDGLYTDGVWDKARPPFDWGGIVQIGLGITDLGGATGEIYVQSVEVIDVFGDTAFVATPDSGHFSTSMSVAPEGWNIIPGINGRLETIKPLPSNATGVVITYTGHSTNAAAGLTRYSNFYYLADSSTSTSYDDFSLPASGIVENDFYPI